MITTTMLPLVVVTVVAQAAWLAPETARSDLARALRVDEAQVLDARPVALQRAGATRGVVVARYRERADSPHLFPVVAIYHPCGAGLCLNVVRFGAAARALAPLRVVDLDEPRTAVAPVERAPVYQAVDEPPRPARWPALLVVVERAEEEPRRVDLVAVSLRDPAAPTELATLELVHRYPDPDQPRGDGPRLIGAHLEGIVFARAGDERTLTVVERALDSRWNRCLRPTPAERRYRLEGAPPKFREVSHRPGSDGCR